MTDDLNYWRREARKQIRLENTLDIAASIFAWAVVMVGIIAVLHLA